MFWNKVVFARAEEWVFYKARARRNSIEAALGRAVVAFFFDMQKASSKRRLRRRWAGGTALRIVAERASRDDRKSRRARARRRVCVAQV